MLTLVIPAGEPLRDVLVPLVEDLARSVLDAAIEDVLPAGAEYEETEIRRDITLPDGRVLRVSMVAELAE